MVSAHIECEWIAFYGKAISISRFVQLWLHAAQITWSVVIWDSDFDFFVCFFIPMPPVVPVFSGAGIGVFVDSWCVLLLSLKLAVLVVDVTAAPPGSIVFWKAFCIITWMDGCSHEAGSLDPGGVTGGMPISFRSQAALVNHEMFIVVNHFQIL